MMSRCALVTGGRLHLVLLGRRHVLEVDVIETRAAAVGRRLIVERDRRCGLAPGLDAPNLERRFRQDVEVPTGVRVNAVDIRPGLLETGLATRVRVQVEVAGVRAQGLEEGSEVALETHVAHDDAHLLICGRHPGRETTAPVIVTWRRSRPIPNRRRPAGSLRLRPHVPDRCGAGKRGLACSLPVWTGKTAYFFSSNRPE